MSESNGQDSVVDILRSSSAIRRGVDSRRVVVEVTGNLESNGDGSNGEEVLHEFILITDSDVHGALGSHSGSNIHVASTVFGSVGVLELGGEASIVVNVLEGVRGKPSAATVVVEVASTVNQLLFGQVQVLSILNTVVSF